MIEAILDRFILGSAEGDEILCFDFAERRKGERKLLFLGHNSLKTRKNAAHFVPSDEKAKSHSLTFTFSGRWAKIANLNVFAMLFEVSDTDVCCRSALRCVAKPKKMPQRLLR